MKGAIGCEGRQVLYVCALTACMATWLRSGYLLLLLPASIEKRWAPKVSVRLRGKAARVCAFVRSLKDRAQFLGDWAVGSRAARTE